MACTALVEGSELVRVTEESLLDARARSVVRALRVWTGKRVRPMVSQKAENRVDLSGTTIFEAAHRPYPFLFGAAPLTDLSADFGTFWRRTRDIFARPPAALEVAFRRVDMMVDQARWNDRVLDLCIILEALFQTGDEKAELSYRLSLRTAHFVGDDKASRQATFDAVKAGYNLRSRIAHGDEASTADQTKQERLESVVFAALRRYCERAARVTGQDAHKAIIRELDAYLLERAGD
jgi:hypothetical protein